MAKKADKRPPVAVGHVSLHVKDVPNASAFMQVLGLRSVFERETFAVLELRGGTHLILNKSRKKLRPSKITTGSVHSSFYVPGPDGWSIKITSSHAGDRPV